MNRRDAEQFCDRWLLAWTGNDPGALIGFYDEGARYVDPTVKEGLTGHARILPYFTKLLKNNPAWRWTREEVMPTEKGFTLKWKARIPVRDMVIEEYGLDIVELAGGRITRNEVYFDTRPLLDAIGRKGD
jgi:hypothetical protein